MSSASGKAEIHHSWTEDNVSWALDLVPFRADLRTISSAFGSDRRDDVGGSRVHDPGLGLSPLKRMGINSVAFLGHRHSAFCCRAEIFGVYLQWELLFFQISKASIPSLKSKIN
jgi:hypothetical protein